MLSKSSAQISGQKDVKDLISRLRSGGAGVTVEVESIVPSLPLTTKLVCVSASTDSWVVDVFVGPTKLDRVVYTEEGNWLTCESWQPPKETK